MAEENKRIQKMRDTQMMLLRLQLVALGKLLSVDKMGRNLLSAFGMLKLVNQSLENCCLKVVDLSLLLEYQLKINILLQLMQLKKYLLMYSKLGQQIVKTQLLMLLSDKKSSI